MSEDKNTVDELLNENDRSKEKKPVIDKKLIAKMNAEKQDKVNSHSIIQK